MTWFPLIEANQGTFSLAALLLALALALSEQHRANAQRSREKQQEIEEALTLFDELESALEFAIELAERRIPETATDLEIVGNALRTLAAAHVKTPTLALALIRGAHLADAFRELPDDDLLDRTDELTEVIHELAGQVQGALTASKQRIAFRRTETRKVNKAVRRVIRTHAARS